EKRTAQPQGTGLVGSASRGRANQPSGGASAGASGNRRARCPGCGCKTVGDRHLPANARGRQGSPTRVGRHRLGPANPGPAGRWTAPPLEHQGPVNHAAFGPGGLVVTAGNDNTARIWDVATGDLLCPPLTHRDWVLHAAFDSTGRRLVTAGCDGTARVWNLALTRSAAREPGQLVRLLAGYRIDGTGGLTVL